MPDNIPLYSEATSSPPSHSLQANQGLWFDKFCNMWDEGFSGLLKENIQAGIKEGKKAWISTVTEKPAGNKSLLDEAQKRTKTLCEAHHGIIVGFRTDGPFVTGLGRNHPVENGFAWHHAYGVPYLPGSSVKGMVRAWAETWDSSLEDEKFLRIFGSSRGEKGAPKNAGSVIFMDALPPRPVKLCVEVMTPHYTPWYRDGEVPGDWHSPVPIPFLAVAENQSFQFGIMPRLSNDESSIQDCRTTFEWLVAALEWIGAGAKTAVGYGRFALEGSLVNLFTAWQQRHEKKRAAIELENAIDQASAELSTLAAELVTESLTNKWATEKNAFSLSGVIEGWLDRLENDPDQDAIVKFYELMVTHYRPVLENPDEVKQKKKKEEFCHKPRQREFAKRMLALLRMIEENP